MKSPEIDPELHGLLDEVVRDPRSVLRRTPRRALLEWFGNPTAAHARPIAATAAERHLVAVYRESLAEILRERALLAFLQDPEFCHPWRDPEGKLKDLDAHSRALVAKVPRAAGFARSSGWFAAYEEIFVLCAGTVDRDQSPALARLSVQLYPSDFGKFTLALTLPRSNPMEAIGLQQRLAIEARDIHRRMDALNDLAGRMAEQGWISLARDQYERALELVPHAVEARCYALNLSCFLMDRDRVLFHSSALEDAAACDAGRVKEAAAIIRRWMRVRDPREVAMVSRFLRGLGDRLSTRAQTLMEGIR